MNKQNGSMMKTFSRIRPGVDKSALLFTAAFMWIAVGAMMLSLAYGWLQRGAVHAVAFAGPGILMALAIHHFGFLKVVDKNLARILPMEGKRCFFSFMSWKSYLMVALMIAMGVALRHSPLPKPYLATVYIAIGLALVLSSLRYLRALLRRHDALVDKSK